MKNEITDQLLSALEPFAKIGAKIKENVPDSASAEYFGVSFLRVEHLRKASAAFCKVNDLIEQRKEEGE